MGRKHQILFIGNGHNALPAMAVSLATPLVDGGVGLIGATLNPYKSNPVTSDVMHEIGLDLAPEPLRMLTEIEPLMFDLVITLGGFKADRWPDFPGMPPRFHWPITDPPPEVSVSEKLAALRRARDQLEEKIADLFSSQTLQALFVARQKLELILDNLVDGVMAHTASRRIFFFNQAAEQITGYRRQDVLGHDCHEVFPGRFCGGDCDFCQSQESSPEAGITKKEITFTRQDRTKRTLTMSVMPLTDNSAQNLGALLSFKDNTELHLLKLRLKHHHALGRMVGKDPKMLEIFDQVREVSGVMVPVLIEGESGTGKELVANAIHEIGPRADKPFVAVNCGALPEGILESELFGHVRGAFSGAIHDRKGRFELADGGTIFLDEIGELSLAMQVKLLRVLQDQRFERVGDERSIQTHARVICATNQNLRRMMGAKRFRRDLFYRLCVYPIALPPLKERRLDIPVLMDHFLERTAREIQRPVLTPANEVVDLLTRYPWPGNVRELHNAIEYGYVKCRGEVLSVEHLPPEIANHEFKRASRPGPALKKKQQVLMALAKAQGNKMQAARYLGVSRATLYRYLDTYQLK